MKQDLERKYQTLREIKINQLKNGYIPRGMVKEILALKLNDQEVRTILYAWKQNNKECEFRLYANALLTRDFEMLKMADKIYLDIMKEEKKAEESQKRG